MASQIWGNPEIASGERVRIQRNHSYLNAIENTKRVEKRLTRKAMNAKFERITRLKQDAKQLIREKASQRKVV